MTTAAHAQPQDDGETVSPRPHDAKLPVAPLPRSALPATTLETEIAAARSFRRRAKAHNTVRAYESDWRSFTTWCDARELDPLPARPEAVATYLAALAIEGKADSTIARHLAAIGWQHRQRGTMPPTARDDRMVIADTLAGIRRDQRARPSARKAAITAADLARMIALAPGQTTRAIRDRAILAIGLAAALRRSELVALQLADVAFAPEGFRVTIRHSKTDQTGTGQTIAVPSGRTLMPGARLQQWLAVRGAAPGPLFLRLDRDGSPGDQPMSDRSIARLIQHYAKAAGLDPATVGGHSLRAGFLTEAARNRASIAKMQEVSRHKRIDVVMGYIRNSELFDDHAGDGFL